jgi:hypothetical protein
MKPPRRTYALTLLISLGAAFSLLCFAGVPAPESVSHKARRTSHGFVELPFDRLPNYRVDLKTARDYHEPLDADSIELMLYRGEVYYHPVFISHRCQRYISAYHHTGDSCFFRRAEKYARKLISLCIPVGDALYAPYPFPFSVHGDTSIAFSPPWFSGMAQGEFLSVLIRLYEISGDEVYLELAQRFFRSFLRLGSSARPWVVRLDSASYYWIEEYPHHVRPGQTLNGFIGAVYGLYDYYRVTKDPRAKLILDLALTTLKDYLPSFRRENQLSYYCLGHRAEANYGYHVLHVRMMRELARITGDPFWEDMAELLHVDGETWHAAQDSVTAK